MLCVFDTIKLNVHLQLREKQTHKEKQVLGQ